MLSQSETPLDSKYKVIDLPSNNFMSSRGEVKKKIKTEFFKNTVVIVIITETGNYFPLKRGCCTHAQERLFGKVVN